MTKRVSVIIVSYNSEDFIEKCIRSVLRNINKEDEVIVFDNASEDKTIMELEKFGNKIKLIRSDKNLGFSKANNEAVRNASGDYLFILNPDTEITQPILNELVEFFEIDEEIGIIAPSIELYNGKIQETVKNLPTVWRAIVEFIFGFKHKYSQYVPETKGKPVEVESVYGVAMLIKKRMFEKLGGFDEKYFLYYEDIDLCRRIRMLGKKIYYFPISGIKHLVGGTKTHEDRLKLNWESAKIYHGLFLAYLLQLVFLIPRLRRRLRLF